MPTRAAACIAVLGAGSWGTALAWLLCHNFAQVKLWGRDPHKLKIIAASGRNQAYLPGIDLPNNLLVEADFSRLVRATDNFLLAVPSQAFRRCVEQLHQHLGEQRRRAHDCVLVSASKGFDLKSQALLSEVVAEIFPAQTCFAVISGPSFAGETAAQMPTALTLAGQPAARVPELAQWFRTPTTRVYTSHDLIGVQLGGAIKNVMAIATGISDGLGYGANARAALITRGLAELSRLGRALGGQAETFMGLTGVGDLILTCTDDQSRNRRFGIGIGQGQSLDAIHASIGQHVEGPNTVRALYAKSRQLKVDMPITEQVYKILYQQQSPSTAVKNLLGREPKPEQVNPLKRPTD